jgi:hypothetical protein
MCMDRCRLKIAVLAGCLALWLVAAGCSAHCQQAQVSRVEVSDTEVKVAPATPIAEKKEEFGQPSWDSDWDITIEKALPAEFLTSKKVARDVKPFCPRYAAMSDIDKRAFWAYFFQALAGAEAGLSPTANVRHTEPEVAVRDTVTKRMVRSEGLLQLTYMDADRYDCDFDWDKDKQLAERDPAKTILQPENNLLCGIKILNNQLVVRKWTLTSRKGYWETLKPGTPGYPVFVKQMKNVPDACRPVPSAREMAKKTQPAGETRTAGDGLRAIK